MPNLSSLLTERKAPDERARVACARCGGVVIVPPGASPLETAFAMLRAHLRCPLPDLRQLVLPHTEALGGP